MIMNGKAPTLISGVPNSAPSLRDDQVAGERDPQRARQHVAVGRAERRLAELADQPEQRREPVGAEVLVHERDLGREAGQVGARGEHPLVRGGEHDAAHAVVLAREREGREQVVEQLGRQRVAVVGLVERDRGDARCRRPRSAGCRSRRAHQWFPREPLTRTFTEARALRQAARMRARLAASSDIPAARSCRRR